MIPAAPLAKAPLRGFIISPACPAAVLSGCSAPQNWRLQCPAIPLPPLSHHLTVRTSPPALRPPSKRDLPVRVSSLPCRDIRKFLRCAPDSLDASSKVKPDTYLVGEKGSLESLCCPSRRPSTSTTASNPTPCRRRPPVTRRTLQLAQRS